MSEPSPRDNTNLLAGRVYAVMKLKGYTSGLSVTKLLKYKNPETLNRILRGESEEPTITFFADLVKLWPDVNLNYVIAGQGEPLIFQHNITHAAEPVAEYLTPDKNANIKAKIELLSTLSALKAKGDITPEEFNEYKSKL